MPPPKTLIVYHSHHHRNTLRIAQAMAHVLEADLRQPVEVPASAIGDYELIGFGSGIYFGQFDHSLKEWIQNLPDSASLYRKQAFVFSTSGMTSLWRLWHWSFKALLAQKGFEVIAEFHCSGFDTVGPLAFIGGLNRRHPDAIDLEQARVFARSLVSR